MYRIKICTVTFFIFFLGTFSVASAAGMKVEQFLLLDKTSAEREDGNSPAAYYLRAVFDTYQMLNVERTSRREPLLYCVPRGEVIDYPRLRQIVYDQLRKDRALMSADSYKHYAGNADFALIVLFAMKSRFPC